MKENYDIIYSQEKTKHIILISAKFIFVRYKETQFMIKREKLANLVSPQIRKVANIFQIRE